MNISITLSGLMFLSLNCTTALLCAERAERITHPSEELYAITDRVRTIERVLSELILTLRATRLPWIRSEVEQVIAQIRILRVKARLAGNEEPLKRILSRLLIKLENTINALEQRWSVVSIPLNEQQVEKRLILLDQLNELHALVQAEYTA